MQSILKKILQIAIVVKDLKKALKIYTEEYGWGPWSIFYFNPEKVKDMIRNDKKVDHEFVVAVTFLRDIEIELIEPLDDKCIYTEFIEEHDEGIHHIAYAVDNYNEAMKFFRGKGLIVSQECDMSCTGDLIVTYISTEKDLKHSAEIYKTVPNYFKYIVDKNGNKRTIYPIPDEVYPPKGSEDKRMESIFKGVLQVGIAVKDLKKALKIYNDGYGIGPWNIYYFNPKKIKNMIRNNKRVDHEFMVATTTLGNIEMELMQPLDDKSIYAEFIKKQGEGIHHIAYDVGDYDKAMKFFISKGLIVTQQGDIGGHIYTYLSTEKDLKQSIKIYKTLPNYFKYDVNKNGNRRSTSFPIPDEVYPIER